MSLHTPLLPHCWYTHLQYHWTIDDQFSYHSSLVTTSLIWVWAHWPCRCVSRSFLNSSAQNSFVSRSVYAVTPPPDDPLPPVGGAIFRIIIVGPAISSPSYCLPIGRTMKRRHTCKHWWVSISHGYTAASSRWTFDVHPDAFVITE